MSSNLTVVINFFLPRPSGIHSFLPLRLCLLQGPPPQLVLQFAVLLRAAGTALTMHWCSAGAALTMHWCMVQDDIMYTNLTVEENLLFSAQYRLPVHYTHAQHVYYVERAIQVSERV